MSQSSLSETNHDSEYFIFLDQRVLSHRYPRDAERLEDTILEDCISNQGRVLCFLQQHEQELITDYPLAYWHRILEQINQRWMATLHAFGVNLAAAFMTVRLCGYSHDRILSVVPRTTEPEPESEIIENFSVRFHI